MSLEGKSRCSVKIGDDRRENETDRVVDPCLDVASEEHGRIASELYTGEIGDAKD